MRRQNLADLLNAQNDTPFEIAVSEFFLHVVANHIPIAGSHFGIDARIAEDGKLLCIGHQKNEDAVSLSRFVHAQFGKGFGGCSNDSIALEFVADVHPDFSRSREALPGQ